MHHLQDNNKSNQNLFHDILNSTKLSVTIYINICTLNLHPAHDGLISDRYQSLVICIYKNNMYCIYVFVSETFWN